VHDLVVSKTVAGREKDVVFLNSVARHGLVSRATLLQRIADTELPPAVRALALERIRDAFAGR
jgi:hypothetical protein